MWKRGETYTFYRRRAPLLLAAVISVITFAIYLSALRNDFVNWDDFDYAYDNYHLRSLSWAFFKWAFTDISLAGYWYPLVWISHALDYAVWGLNPLGHHLTSILLHAANAFLATYLIIKLFDASNAVRLRSGLLPALDERAVLIAAGITGILFGLHPLHVESAVWISERKDLLYSLFYLLSIMAYTGYVLGLERETRRNGIWAFLRNGRYLLSFVVFLLSLSCKAMAVTLPVVLLLLDWYPFRRHLTRQSMILSFVEKIPFLLCSLLISIVSVIGQKALGALAQLDSVGLPVRVLVAFKALMMYLWKMAAPVDLLPFYPYPENISFPTLEYLVPVILACMITAGCIFLVKRRPFLLLLWGYYVITVLPVIGLVPVGTHYLADRYAYLPSLGPFLLAGLAAAWVWTKADSVRPGGRAIKGFAVVSAISLLMILCSLTVKQIGIWRNSIVFWSYLIEKEGHRVPVAYCNRGLAYLKLHQLDRALEDLTTAIALKPDHPDYYNNRGLVFREKGQVDRAMEDFNAAIRVEPRLPDAYVNRGGIFREKGQTERALEDYTTAIALDPKGSVAYYARGMILQETGQPDPAIADFTAAIALNPFNAQAYVQRGVTFDQTGRIDLALEDYTSAIKSDPSFANAYNNRGLALERTGRLDQAMEDLNTAIRLNPSGVEAYNNRGLVFEDLGRFDRAIEDYGRAIELQPEDYLSYNNRGIAFAKMGRIDRAIEDQTKALYLKPDYDKAYLERGDLYLKTGRPALAALDFQKACGLGSRDGCDALRTVRKP